MKQLSTFILIILLTWVGSARQVCAQSMAINHAATHAENTHHCGSEAPEPSEKNNQSRICCGTNEVAEVAPDTEIVASAPVSYEPLNTIQIGNTAVQKSPDCGSPSTVSLHTSRCLIQP